jgi:hypothetical protein
MEKLQEILMNKISELVPDSNSGNVPLLDALNRLLGTVNNYLLSREAIKNNLAK